MKTKQSTLLKTICSIRPLILAGLVAIFACLTPTPLMAWDWRWQSEDLQTQLDAARESQIICQHEANAAFQAAQNARHHARTVTRISLAAWLCAAGVIAYLIKRGVFNRPIIKKEIVQNVVCEEKIVRSPAHDLVADMVVIDGLNVIYGNPKSQKRNLNNLLALVLGLQERNCKFICFFDPSTIFSLDRFGRGKAANIYRRLCWEFPDLFIEVPGGNKADDYILDYAHKTGALIISNDLFRQYHEKYGWLQSEPNRRTSFQVRSGVMQVLHLGIEANIPYSLSAAAASFWPTPGKPAPVIADTEPKNNNNHAPLNGEMVQAVA